MQLDNPKHELFTQAILKHQGHLSLAYQEVYPSANPDSARHGGSDLWRKVEIRMRVTELLEAKGLGVVESIKKLKELTEAKKAFLYHGGGVIYVPDNGTSLEAIKTALRIHGLLGHKSDIIGVYLSPEQLTQMAKDQEILNEKKPDNPQELV